MTERTKQISIFAAIALAGLLIFRKLSTRNAETLSDTVFASQDYNGAPLPTDSIYFPRLGMKQQVPNDLLIAMPPTMPVQQFSQVPEQSADVSLPQTPAPPAPVAATNPCCDECSQMTAGTVLSPRKISDLALQRAVAALAGYQGKSTTAVSSGVIGSKG